MKGSKKVVLVPTRGSWFFKDSWWEIRSGPTGWSAFRWEEANGGEWRERPLDRVPFGDRTVGFELWELRGSWKFVREISREEAVATVGMVLPPRGE